MTLFRIVLIPFILYSYYSQKNYVLTACLVIISGLTDIADGIIARKFDMISDVGKIIDPVADKLTQATLIICLMSKYKLMYVMIAVFAVKEIIIIILGYIALTRKNFMNSARWYGKVCTVIVEVVIIFLILFGHFLPDNVEMPLACALISIAIVAIVFSLLMYSFFYIKVLSGQKIEENAEKAPEETENNAADI